MSVVTSNQVRTKEKGFILPVLLLALIGLGSYFFYLNKHHERDAIKENAEYIARSLNWVINDVQLYQLKKAKEDQNNGVLNPLIKNEFPRNLKDLAVLGNIPNCVTNPRPSEQRSNCQKLIRSPFGFTDMYLDKVDNSKINLNIDITHLKYKEIPNIMGMVNDLDLDPSVKKNIMLVDLVRGFIPRTSIEVKNGKQFLVIPIFAANSYITVVPKTYLKKDGSVKLENDWNIGNKILTVRNNTLQLTDGTTIGTSNIIIAAGVTSANISGNTSFLDGRSLQTSIPLKNLQLCNSKYDPKPPTDSGSHFPPDSDSDSTRINPDDLNVSLFISSIFPIIDANENPTFDRETGKLIPGKLVEMKQNVLGDLFGFNTSYSISYEYSSEDDATEPYLNVSFKAIGHNINGQNGTWGNNQFDRDINGYNKDFINPDIGAHLSYIVSCKAKTK
ncbi:hypothetical protein [Photobacterium damselae]|uniref:hypothetical protein n=1 Tax=Photobacterium damselae TaxID=38293 RepID=UPI004067D437